MPKYKVTYEYRAKVTVQVEAENEEAAEEAAQEEADEGINGATELYDVQVREIR